jgi:transcriptional regulator with XRE-family HTH domain
MGFDRKTLAANLGSLRGGRHMSRREVAEATGLKKSTIDGVETMKGKLTYEDAWTLANFYGVGIDELGGRDISKRCKKAPETEEVA